MPTVKTSDTETDYPLRIKLFDLVLMLQAQIIASKIEELKKLWQSLTDQLSPLQQQEVLETRAEERLRLGQLIVQIRTKREQVEQEMLQLEVAAGDDGREALRDSERIQRVMDQLPGRAFEILEVIQAVGLKLKKMKQDGLCTECDKALLKGTEQFLAGVLDAEAFIRSVKQLNRTEQETEDRPNYERLAERLNRGQVILCLGQEFSGLLGARSPSTSLIRERLAGKEGVNSPLSEICEQKELTPDIGRAELLNEFRSLFDAEGQLPAVLPDLLARIEQPFIILAAGYDDFPEQCLRGRRQFVVIYPHMKEKKCLLRYTNGQEICCAPEEISQHKPLENGFIVIYRLRGAITHNAGQLLLSERDYFAATRCMENQFPDYIGSRLKNSLYSLWFMGHYPESWEERLVVKFLQSLRYDRASALTVQEKLSPFARAFWQDSEVRVHNLPLADFIHGLEKTVL